MVDGCGFHSVTPDAVTERWARVEEIVGFTPEDDHDAQWSFIAMCACCLGPTRGNAELCSRCERITAEQYESLLKGKNEAAA